MTLLQALQGPARQLHHQERSGLPLRTLRWVGEELCKVPAGFQLHPSVAALIAGRRSTALQRMAARR